MREKKKGRRTEKTTGTIMTEIVKKTGKKREITKEIMRGRKREIMKERMKELMTERMREITIGRMTKITTERIKTKAKTIAQFKGKSDLMGIY